MARPTTGTTSSATSLQKFAAFPNGGGGHGEDVIWEQRGRNGFISSHRVFKTGTHTGYWTYGPPTGRDWVSRTVAHCLVQDNKVLEEWLVRDEWAVLQHLGLDPYAVAADLADASPVLGGAMRAGGDTGAFAGHIADPARLGVSGARPPTSRRASAPLVTGDVRGGLEPAAVQPRAELFRPADRLPLGADEAGAGDRSLPDRADQPARDLPRLHGRGARHRRAGRAGDSGCASR